jgi:hypothetical protein
VGSVLRELVGIDRLSPGEGRGLVVGCRRRVGRVCIFQGDSGCLCSLCRRIETVNGWLVCYGIQIVINWVKTFRTGVSILYKICERLEVAFRYIPS